MTEIDLGARPISGQLNFFNDTACVITIAPPADVEEFLPETTAELHIYSGTNIDTAVYEGVLSVDLTEMVITVPAENVTEHIIDGVRTFGLLFDGVGCITGKIKYFSGKAGDKNVEEAE